MLAGIAEEVDAAEAEAKRRIKERKAEETAAAAGAVSVSAGVEARKLEGSRIADNTDARPDEEKERPENPERKASARAEERSGEGGRIVVDDDTAAAAATADEAKRKAVGSEQEVNGKTAAEPKALEEEREEIEAEKELTTKKTEEVQASSIETKQPGEPVAIKTSNNTDEDVKKDNGSSNGARDYIHNDNEQNALGFMVLALRKELGDRHQSITDANLLKFLRWKPDVSRAAERFRAHIKWQQANPFAFTDKPLLISQDPALSLVLQSGLVVAPENMICKDGSAVMVVRPRKNDAGKHADEEIFRAILYTIDRMLARRDFDQSLGITIVLDLTGASRSNISDGLPKVLSGAIGSVPLRLRSIQVVSMPWWFSSSYKNMFSPKLGKRIGYLKSKSCLSGIIEEDLLLDEDGGKQVHNMQSWISANMLREIDGDFDSLGNCAASHALMVALLRKELGDQSKGVTDANLVKFLRWKPDLSRAADRFRAHVKWHQANPFAFTDKSLLISEDPRLSLLLQSGFVIAPEDMMAKDGSAVIMIRPRKNDRGDEFTDKDVCRAILYLVDRVLERSDFDQSLGITIILDMTGASKGNMTSGVPKLLSKAIGSFPLRIRSMYVICKPWWFSNSYRNMFSPKLDKRISYFKDTTCLSGIIEMDLLLEEDGGKLKHDIQSWISANVLREIDGNFDSLANCAVSLAE